MVTGQAFGEQQHDGSTLAVAGGMEPGVQAILGAADAARKSPFLRGLTAVRCALRVSVH